MIICKTYRQLLYSLVVTFATPPRWNHLQFLADSGSALCRCKSIPGYWNKDFLDWNNSAGADWICLKTKQKQANNYSTHQASGANKEFK